MTRFTTLIAAGLLAAASAGAALAFGAIAVDDSFGDDGPGLGYGFVTLLPTKDEATRAAMEACQSEGNTDCKVVLTFWDCGAYAASRNNFGVGAGPTLAEAEDAALKSCGDRNCAAVVSDCE